MKRPEKQVCVRVPPEIYRQLRDKCAQKSSSMQDLLVDLIVCGLDSGSSPEKPKDRGKGREIDVLALLRECPILKDLDPSELKGLAERAVCRHYNKGQIIIREGEDSDSLKVVANGMVKVFRTSSGGRELFVEVLSRGDIYGASNLITRFMSSSVGLQARGEVDIVSIPKEDFLAFVSSNPAIMNRFSGWERERIDLLLTKLTSLVTEKAGERVLAVISELTNKHGRTLYFKHKEIAEMSGTTNETVTRILAQLKNQGAIQLSRCRITVLNKDKITF